MIWDAGWSQANLISHQTYGNQVKDLISGNKNTSLKTPKS